MNISERQKKLLEAIIKEFIETAEAVGSLSIGDKYDLDISPATIRNEMVRLVKEGYLDKEHSSSGRVPTTLGWRFFLQELMDEILIDPHEEVKLKEQLFQERFNREQLIRKAVYNLSSITELPAIALFDNISFLSGIGELVSCPEFSEIEILQNVINILEDYSLLSSVFENRMDEEDDEVRVLIGNEMGFETCENCAIVFKKFRLHRDEDGIIATFGPKRMDYEKVIPSVRAISSMISEVISGW